MTTRLSRASITSESPSPSPLVVRRADRWLRDRSLLFLAIMVVASFSWPEYASHVLDRGTLVRLPLDLSYDARTLALALIVFSASLRCTPRDFTRVFVSKGGFANLVAVYLFVPAMALGIAYGTVQFGGEHLRGIAVGLLLSVMVPVAMTSAVWTRASQGSVPLALGTLAVTSLLAVILMPLLLGHLAGVPGLELGASLHHVRMQVVLAFAVPLLLGTTIRASIPAFADLLEPFFSIVSMFSLLAFVADSASAVRPHLATHQGALGIAVVLTVLLNAGSYGVGYLVARARGLDDAETVAVVFGTGMRSVPAALVVGALAFPTLPLVGLPPILWSVTQQLLAGVITRRFLNARDQAEPVLPLKRRVVEAVKRASCPSLADSIETEIVAPLRDLEDTLVYRPRKPSAPSFSAE